MLEGSVNLPDAADRKMWLRAFYGFDPEGAGYMGFTSPTDRKEMLARMKPGDLVLIYGAVQEVTDQCLRAQALGFLQVTNEICDDRSQMSVESYAWKVNHGFENRWTHGIKVDRAWRILNRVHIRTIAPASFHNDYRFERTRRAKVLDSEEVILAMSHFVREVPVFGQEPIELLQQSIPFSQYWEPTRGPKPSFGTRTSEYNDSQCCVYLMALAGMNDRLLGRNSAECLFKVGRANDPTVRLKDLNAGFPPSSLKKWGLIRLEKFPSQLVAHEIEQEIISNLKKDARSEGGEFFSGTLKNIETIYGRICTDHMHRILGASARASGLK